MQMSCLLHVCLGAEHPCHVDVIVSRRVDSCVVIIAEANCFVCALQRACWSFAKPCAIAECAYAHA